MASVSPYCNTCGGTNLPTLATIIDGKMAGEYEGLHVAGGIELRLCPICHAQHFEWGRNPVIPLSLDGGRWDGLPCFRVGPSAPELEWRIPFDDLDPVRGYMYDLVMTDRCGRPHYRFAGEYLLSDPRMTLHGGYRADHFSPAS